METFSYDDGNGGLVSEEARSECNGDNGSKATRFAVSSDGGGDNDRTVVSERGPWVSSSRLFFFPRLFPLFFCLRWIHIGIVVEIKTCMKNSSAILPTSFCLLRNEI